MPIVLARMAVCELAEPSLVTKESNFVLSICTVSDGAISSAIRITGSSPSILLSCERIMHSSVCATRTPFVASSTSLALLTSSQPGYKMLIYHILPKNHSCTGTVDNAVKIRKHPVRQLMPRSAGADHKPMSHQACLPQCFLR